MIEIIVKDYLAGQLAVPVYMERPEDPTAEYVVLRKADSEREDQLDAATFVADSYAGTLLEAAQLNQQVLACVDGLADLPEVSEVRRGGDYPLNDTQNKQHRYQAVFDITHY